MPAAAVHVYGLREVRKVLAAADPAAARALQRGMKRAAQQLVPKIQAAYPKRTGELAGSVRASAGGQSQTIRVRPSEPYVGPVDFGGYPRPRPFIADGRYLYPTINNNKDLILRNTQLAVAQAIESLRAVGAAPVAGL